MPDAHVLETLTGILIPLGFFSLVGFIVSLQARRASQRVAAQFHVCGQALEKAGSAEDLARFLETEAGRRVIDFITAVDTHANRGVLRVLQVGIVFIASGIAFFVLAPFVDDGDMVIPGVLGTVIGAGLVIAAWVSRRLAQRWSTQARSRSSAVQDPYRLGVDEA